MNGQRPRHGERPGGIHIGGDNGDAVILALLVKKNEITGNIDFRARSQCRALRADENIFEIEFQILFNAHCRLLFRWLTAIERPLSLFRT
jgi:hypothetical protein